MRHLTAFFFKSVTWFLIGYPKTNRSTLDMSLLLAETRGAQLSSCFADGGTADFQAIEFILQPGSDDELEVDHDESSNESVENEDFSEDVLKINGNPEYETDEDAKLNDKPGANDGGEENCFVGIFQSSQKTYKQCC